MPTAPRTYRPPGTPTARQREQGWASRAPAIRSLYNDLRWRREGTGLRDRQKQKEPLCRACAALGLVVIATDVDHVIPHGGDPEKFFAEDNLQSLCKQCHSRKTISEPRGNGRTRQ